jgi:hypothetical protein
VFDNSNYIADTGNRIRSLAAGTAPILKNIADPESDAESEPA